MSNKEVVTPIELHDVLSCDSQFWTCFLTMNSDHVISSEVKHKIINNALLKRHSSEECLLIKQEMKNVLLYYEEVETCVHDQISKDSQSKQGATSILKQYEQRVVNAKKSAMFQFSNDNNCSSSTFSSDVESDDDESNSDMSVDESDSDANDI